MSDRRYHRSERSSRHLSSDDEADYSRTPNRPPRSHQNANPQKQRFAARRDHHLDDLSRRTASWRQRSAAPADWDSSDDTEKRSKKQDIFNRYGESDSDSLPQRKPFGLNSPRTVRETKTSPDSRHFALILEEQEKFNRAYQKLVNTHQFNLQKIHQMNSENQRIPKPDQKHPRNRENQSSFVPYVAPHFRSEATPHHHQENYPERTRNRHDNYAESPRRNQFDRRNALNRNRNHPLSNSLSSRPNRFENPPARRNPQRDFQNQFEPAKPSWATKNSRDEPSDKDDPSSDDVAASEECSWRTPAKPIEDDKIDEVADKEEESEGNVCFDDSSAEDDFKAVEAVEELKDEADEDKLEAVEELKDEADEDKLEEVEELKDEADEEENEAVIKGDSKMNGEKE